MIRDLVYNDKSLRSIGFLLSETEPFIQAERDVIIEDIAGRNGALVQDYGSYKNIELSYTINSFPYWLENKSDSEIVNNLTDWFFNHGNYKLLRDLATPDYFYYAIPKSIEKIEKVAYKTFITTITFSCKPFKYYYNGMIPREKRETNHSITMQLNNPTIYNSEPYIKVETNGAFDLYVNNDLIIISGCSGYIEIDKEKENVFKDDIDLNSFVNCDYLPNLKSGLNTITAVSNTSNNIIALTVIPRWRRL